MPPINQDDDNKSSNSYNGNNNNNGQGNINANSSSPMANHRHNSGSDGVCRVFNRIVLSDIVSQAQAEKAAEEARRLAQQQMKNSGSYKGGNTNSSNSYNNNFMDQGIGGGQTGNLNMGGQYNPYPTYNNNYAGSPLHNHSIQGSSVTNFKSKTKDVLSKLKDLRCKDQRLIRETLDRHKELREQRFERLMRSVTGEDIYLRSDVTELLRIYGIEKSKQQAENYQNWNTNVYENIQKQLDKILNPINRSLVQELSGIKNVEFTLPDNSDDSNITKSNNYKDNPSYKQLNQYYKENKFRREMDLLLSPNSYPHNGSLSQSMKKDYNHLNNTDEFGNDYGGNVIDQLDRNNCGYNTKLGLEASELDSACNPSRDPRYARSRPVLEPELWEQLKLQGTPFGHFAQVCAEGPGFKTSVKTGNHAPVEIYDGVAAAGKRKTRWGRNDLGILDSSKGDVANRGESSKYKTDLGSSCGAPNQDHFTFEQTVKVTDSEFPVGKKMYAHKH